MDGSATRVPDSLRQLVATAETSPAADTIANALAPMAERLASSDARPLLRGEWLGHAAHPMLTDVPIGFFTAATVLDLVGGKQRARAAQRLVALGLLSTPMVMATGMVDWKEAAATDDRVRRAGAVHAAGNLLAGFLYLRSWQARRRGRRWAGILLGLAGGIAASGSGFLGGHLAIGRGVGSGERGLELADRDERRSGDTAPPSNWAASGTGQDTDATEDLVREAPIPR